MAAKNVYKVGEAGILRLATAEKAKQMKADGIKMTEAKDKKTRKRFGLA